MNGDYLFERGALELGEIVALSTQIWVDLAFDDDARAALKRDGLALDAIRLTGPNPFTLTDAGDGNIEVSVVDGPDAQALLDLWLVHFARVVRTQISFRTPA